MFKQSFKVFFTIVMILFVFFSCSRTKKTSVVRINNSPSMTSATGHLIKELKLMEKYLPQVIKVEWSDIAVGPDIRDAIVSEKVDIGDIAVISYLSAVENNYPLVMLSSAGKTQINVYSNRSDIKSFNDFTSSDRIAITSKGTNLHAAFMTKCYQIFGDPMKFDNLLVSIPAADAIASIQSSNDFDGAIFSFPNTVRVKDIANLTLISDMSDVINEYNIGSLYFTSESFYKNNPELIDAFLKAQIDANNFAATDPEKAAEVLSRIFEIEKDCLVEALLALPLTNVASGLEKQAEILYGAGMLKNKP